MNEEKADYFTNVINIMTDLQKKTWNKFDSLILTNRAKSNRKTYYSMIKKFLKILDKKDFEKADREDFEKFHKFLYQDVRSGKKSSRKEGIITSYRTISGYIIRLKRFYKWIYEQENKPLPDYFRSELFKIKSIKTPAVKKEQILTEDEIFTLVKNCKTPRDQCLIALMYETFSRISEVLALKIKDIKGDPNKFRFIEKTIFKLGSGGTEEERETREIPIGISGYYLDNWLRIHPHKDDPEAPLFTTYKNKNEFLSKRQASFIIQEAGKLANLGKSVRSHLIRHSAITNKRNLMKITDKDTRYFAGWSINSDMLKVYDKFTDTGKDERASRLLGKEIVDISETQTPKIMNCPRCNAENYHTEDYCVRCHLNLKLPFSDEYIEYNERIKKLDEREEELDRLIDEVKHEKTRVKGEEEERDFNLLLNENEEMRAMIKTFEERLKKIEGKANG